MISFFLFRRYKINDFPSENVFLVSMNVSICFESKGPCETEFLIMKHVKLHKPLCDFDEGFKIKSKYIDRKMMLILFCEIYID